MKNLLILSALFLFLSATPDKNSSDAIKSDGFKAALDSVQMVFTPPKGLVEIPIPAHGKIKCHKAYKHPTEKFEIRYAVRRHNLPNFDAILHATALMISDEKPPKNTKFRRRRLKKYNADKGGQVMVSPNEEFAKDYKYCMIVCINKKGIGDGLYFYLVDDLTILPKLNLPTLYTLRFKKVIQ